jgi:glycosyltransferase involved in cell wall biosynthesis
MRIGFLVERPTQFEAPFYRFAARDAAHRFEVFFTEAEPSDSVFDPELARDVSWGIDLYGGYPHVAVPASDRLGWLTAELERRRLDLLIINGYTRLPYLAGLLAARRNGIATALRLDSVDAGSGPRRLAKRLLFASFLRPAFDLFLATGTLTLLYLKFLGIPAERTGLFPYAIDVEAFRAGSRLTAAERASYRERLGVPSDGPIVLSLAKFGEREAPWDLLRAFALTGDPRAHLVLAGDGPERPALEAWARSRGLDRVRFPGYIPYPELPRLYASCDLFVHPAREERWGVSVAEALACGLPVVASSGVGAARDLLREGENGATYRAGDASGLARRIAQALALPRDKVAAASAEILARWDYAATWRAVLAAAARIV